MLRRRKRSLTVPLAGAARLVPPPTVEYEREPRPQLRNVDQAHRRLDEAARLHAQLAADVTRQEQRLTGHAGLLTAALRAAKDATEEARRARAEARIIPGISADLSAQGGMIDALANRVSECEDAMHEHPTEGDSAEADELAAWQRNIEEQLGALAALDIANRLHRLDQGRLHPCLDARAGVPHADPHDWYHEQSDTIYRCPGLIAARALGGPEPEQGDAGADVMQHLLGDALADARKAHRRSLAREEEASQKLTEARTLVWKLRALLCAGVPAEHFNSMVDEATAAFLGTERVLPRAPE